MNKPPHDAERDIPELEAQMIAAATKAWELLAPLGVETADLKALIDDTVHSAWGVQKK